MTDTILLVQGDQRPYILLNLTNADGTAVDLTDSQTTVQVVLRNSTTKVIAATLPCAKTGVAGQVQFNFPGSALSVDPGNYEGEIQVKFGSENQTVYDTLKFKVRAQFS